MLFVTNIVILYLLIVVEIIVNQNLFIKINIINNKI